MELMQVGHHLLWERRNSHTYGNRGVAAMTARIPRIHSWEYVKRVPTRKLSEEDRFGRKYYCCWYNHPAGWAKAKKTNRRTMRRKLKLIGEND